MKIIWLKEIQTDRYLEHIQVDLPEFQNWSSIPLQMWWQWHSRCQYLFHHFMFYLDFLQSQASSIAPAGQVFIASWAASLVAAVDSA